MRACRLRSQESRPLRAARAEVERLRAQLTKKRLALRKARLSVRRLRSASPSKAALARALQDARAKLQAIEVQCAAYREQIRQSYKREAELVALAQRQQGRLLQAERLVADLRDEITEGTAREKSLRSEVETLRQSLTEVQSQLSAAVKAQEAASLASAGQSLTGTQGEAAARGDAVNRLLASFDSLPLLPADDKEDRMEAQRRIEEAKRRGWRPEHDPLVREKKRELIAEKDHALAQHRRGKLLPVSKAPSEDDLDFLAQRDVLAAREQYYRTPPADRRTLVYWVSGGRLDTRSEFELSQAIKERTRRLLSRR